MLQAFLEAWIGLDVGREVGGLLHKFGALAFTRTSWGQVDNAIGLRAAFALVFGGSLVAGACGFGFSLNLPPPGHRHLSRPSPACALKLLPHLRAQFFTSAGQRFLESILLPKKAHRRAPACA